tara:strand:+ start:619 stop:735 length:117 start_codon:yes stop_codon:yes gene_type:complete
MENALTLIILMAVLTVSFTIITTKYYKKKQAEERKRID